MAPRQLAGLESINLLVYPSPAASAIPALLRYGYSIRVACSRGKERHVVCPRGRRHGNASPSWAIARKFCTSLFVPSVLSGPPFLLSQVSGNCRYPIDGATITTMGSIDDITWSPPSIASSLFIFLGRRSTMVSCRMVDQSGCPGSYARVPACSREIHL